MARVKFNVNTEYGFLNNFKILQSTSPLTFTTKPEPENTDSPIIDCFTKHQIDRPIVVESLIKCKMQDNLEFLQWTKRYWDQYYPGGDYDAVGRRKGSGPPPAAAPSAPAPRTSGSGAGAGAGAARRGTTPTTLAAGRIRTPQAGGNSSVLLAENNQLKETIIGLERERDFYFSKLRDIELLVQQAVEADPEIEKDEDGLIKHVQAVLYSTEVRTCRHLVCEELQNG